MRLVTGVAIAIGGVCGAICGVLMAFLAFVLLLAVLFESIWSIVSLVW